MKFWTAAALALAVGVAGVSAQAQPRSKSRQPPPPAVAAPPPAPVLPPPDVEPLQYAVRTYAAFQNDVSDLRDAPVGSADDLDRVLERAAAQNREALMRGWLAYGALTAAQSPEFVRGVRETAAHYGNAAFIRGLTLDPGYAQVLKGGPEAAQLALASARADGERVYQVGARIKEMAYGLQKQRWAMQVAPQQPARVNRMKALAQGAGGRSVTPEMLPRLEVAAGALSPTANPSQFGGIAFWDSLRAAPLASPTPVSAPSMPAPSPGPAPVLRTNQDRVGAVNRMTTLAALYIVGATKDPAAQVDRLLSEGSTGNCLEIAQVQFYQCLSAARFRYENAFCVGEHALKEMGACIRDASVIDGQGASTPVAGLPVRP